MKTVLIKGRIGHRNQRRLIKQLRKNHLATVYMKRSFQGVTPTSPIHQRPNPIRRRVYPRDNLCLLSVFSNVMSALLTS